MKTLEIIPLQKSAKTEITIPGSKSYTNRALLLAALTKESVKIINPLISDDTRALIECLKKLGIKVSKGSNYLNVESNISSVKKGLYDLNANLSGTTIRFMLALATIIPGVKTLYGTEELNKRPIGDLVEALKTLGAKIEYLDKKEYPPVKVLSSKLNPGTIKIKGSVSSQYLSALLMISPFVGEVTIEVLGDQVSKPYIDMTIDIIEKFGVKVLNKEYKAYIIAPQKYIAKQYLVEGDLSSASYFLAIAVLTKSTITLKNINPNSKQADMRFVKILKDMGNKIVYGKNHITISGKEIKPVNLDMADCPDQIQTMAVLAAFSKGVTKISGISSLRIKETDRIFALTQELKKMGIKTSSTETTLTIYGGDPKSASIETYGDHRMAMAFAIAGAKLSGMKIVNPDVVNKTFPEFWEKLSSIGIKTNIVNSKNIILIGMRGSGKTTMAKILAKKLNKQYLELDEMLVKKMNMSITQIVKKYGWDFFRDQESEIVKQVADGRNLVISTGGGVVTRPENTEALKRNGLLIFLNASVEILSKRIGEKIGYDPKMPALTNKKTPKAEITHILNQREKLYKQAADQIIETDGLTSNQLANIIISKFQGRLL